GVIKEELNMCLDSESRDVYVMNMKQALSNSKFASDIVGRTENNVSSIKFKDIENFKKEHNMADNATKDSIFYASDLHKGEHLRRYWHGRQQRFAFGNFGNVCG
ncbi:MAG: hypothetical protein IJ318_01740, partial [Clostridia bacterium]|nr:hypothetical protein [Clostridia bacterium]